MPFSSVENWASKQTKKKKGGGGEGGKRVLFSDVFVALSQDWGHLKG